MVVCDYNISLLPIDMSSRQNLSEMLEFNNIMNKMDLVENGRKVREEAPTSSLLQGCTVDSQDLVDECTVKPYSMNRRIKEGALFFMEL